MNRRLLALVAGGLLATLLPLASTNAAGAPAATPDRGQDSSWTQTKTLTRTFVDASGDEYSFPSRTVTVTVDQTENLRGRQRVRVRWSGAQPSAARASNPYGENGLAQEYPVVVLQCRGLDDPDLPPAKQVSPETCWTASVAQRSQITRSEGESAWLHDRVASEEDQQRLSGVKPFPSAEECPTADIAPYNTRLTPFRAADGTTYLACDSDHMPPEAAVGAAFPPAELAAFTDDQGRGEVQFEVRSDVENESLGCSNTVACSIVVIPIVGLSCEAPSSPATTSDAACRRGGRFLPGSSNFSSEGVDQAVSPSLWWSASNWQNRFSIPITFGLPPDACDVLDPRPPTGFYGSELLSQAALQWSPAYCLDKSRFKFQHNQMSDEAGWNLMESGGGAAALVSSRHERRGSDPVGYAPTAVSGFSVGYVVDKPDNQGEFTRLRLNARLLAKLLTQSYLGSDLGRGHPGIADNPLSINLDPEFVELNPGLSVTAQEAAATVLSLSNSSDVVQQLTDYIARDRAAMAFVNGAPDPYGMVVNPAYRKLSLPRAEWPLLDDYVPETENTCRQENPGVYFNQLAAPVTTLRKIAEALLDAWPNVQTRCEYDASTQLYKVGRVDRQSYGSRFMLGIVSLADAERYGLRSAALKTARGGYVAPTLSALRAAVAVAEQPQRYGPFDLDQAALATSPEAYPGTMIVYTAARLQNLPAEDAARVAQFMRISTTEGQRVGSGNGQLPAGYLPITSSGATAGLFRAAQETADAVEAQRTAPAPAPGGGGGEGGGFAGSGGVAPQGVPGATSPPTGAQPPRQGAAKPAEEQTVAMPPTTAVSSRLGGGLIPALLLVGLLAGLGAGATRFFVRRPPGGAP